AGSDISHGVTHARGRPRIRTRVAPLGNRDQAREVMVPAPAVHVPLVGWQILVAQADPRARSFGESVTSPVEGPGGREVPSPSQPHLKTTRLNGITSTYAPRSMSCPFRST